MGTMTLAALTGAVIFLALGLAELAVVNRTIYPAFRWRYEAAKVTQNQGLKPSTLMALVKFQSLILMPVAGYMLGGRMTSMSG